MTTTTTTRPIAPMPGCHACNGTGIDTSFGTECSECLRDAERDALLRARFNAPTNRDDRFQLPGERLDGRTFARTTTPARPAHRPNQYPGTCPECQANVAANEGSLTKENGRWVTRHVGACPVSRRRAVPCRNVVAVTGLDLSPLKQYTSRSVVRFGVPGSDTRLKVRIKFARNGAVYVDDGAVYGEGRSYGRQYSDSAYRGEIVAELTAILADPLGALKRYAELTDSCGVCGLHLEDKLSIERGVGPVCWAKVG